MDISLHNLATETFAPMLRSLSHVLAKGAEHAKAKNVDPAVLVAARLALDMYPLARQVQFACDQAKNSVARLMGQEPPKFADDETTIEELRARIAKTIAYLETASAADFAAADSREYDFPLPNDAGAIVMKADQFLRDWTLPHFYFHLVTAYDILRANGVEIGKRDYMGRVAAYIRPKQK